MMRTSIQGQVYRVPFWVWVEMQFWQRKGFVYVLR